LCETTGWRPPLTWPDTFSPDSSGETCVFRKSAIFQVASQFDRRAPPWGGLAGASPGPTPHVRTLPYSERESETRSQKAKHWSKGQAGKREQARGRTEQSTGLLARDVALSSTRSLPRPVEVSPVLATRHCPSDTWHPTPDTCFSSYFAHSPCVSWRFGSTSNQANAPVPHKSAATPNEAPQPKREAINGVSVAVTVLPICAPMFMTPETEPADSPAMSAVTDQNVLCDK